MNGSFITGTPVLLTLVLEEHTIEVFLSEFFRTKLFIVVLTDAFVHDIQVFLFASH